MFLLILTLLTAIGALAHSPSARATPHVLVYHRALADATHGFVHPAIPYAVDSLRNHGPSRGISFDFSEDPTLFVDSKLSVYDGIMFVLNSEEILDRTQQAALKRYWQKGGVFVGVHSACAALWNDTDFAEAVGAKLWYHPLLQNTSTFIPLNKRHPAMVNVPDRWTIEEEVYFYRSDPRKLGHKLLMTVDESSFKNINQSVVPGTPAPGMGYEDIKPHPIAWCNERPRSAFPLARGVKRPGRSFFTTLGHSISTWSDPVYLDHLFGGLQWTLDGASTLAYGEGLVGNATRVCRGCNC